MLLLNASSQETLARLGRISDEALAAYAADVARIAAERGDQKPADDN
ncbi:MAG TPA: hypothetical protein VMK84_25065 [Streptosporangiaceae bacterium]|nr:hypothetical protein [Streptosporangiaceae bacterium]